MLLLWVHEIIQCTSTTVFGEMLTCGAIMLDSLIINYFVTSTKLVSVRFDFQFLTVKCMERNQVWQSKGWVFMGVTPPATLKHCTMGLLQEETKNYLTLMHKMFFWNMSYYHCSLIKIRYYIFCLLYICNKGKKF